MVEPPTTEQVLGRQAVLISLWVLPAERMARVWHVLPRVDTGMFSDNQELTLMNLDCELSALQRDLERAKDATARLFIGRRYERGGQSGADWFVIARPKGTSSRDWTDSIREMTH